MKTDQPFPDDDAHEAKTFTALNHYLEQLQADGKADRDRILGEHPELAGTLANLDILDRLGRSARDLFPEHATVSLGSGRGPEEEESTPSSSAPETPLDWKEFGKFELLEEIGRGGMGVVFKARQIDLDRLVAIKMIQASRLASSEDVARFYAEARAAGRLHHPNIISVFETGQVHGQHFFAMTYVHGPSLADLLHKGPLPVEQAVRCLAAVSRAVHYLHTQGIVHRDLKPSNILLDENGQPYVTDFGLVKMLGGSSRLTSTGAIVGTPSFMAPEQASGRQREVGPVSDVYSLGALLYALLTGRAPFAESSPLDTLVQVLEGEPAPPRLLNPQVPPAVETICLKCLEKAAQDRYASAAALADDLERYLRGEEVQAQPRGPVQRLRAWSRREPPLASHLAVLGICTVIAQVRYHMSSQQASLLLHLEVLGILALWMLASVGLQQLLGREKWTRQVRCLWSGTDVLCLSAILYLIEGLDSPLVIGYPLLIVASGLWFYTGPVWFTTMVSLFGYGGLLLAIVSEDRPILLPHYHVIFALALVAEGFIVAYQVKRVRALSRYYENRPLP